MSAKDLDVADMYRAGLYGLLSRAISAAPDQEFLNDLKQLDGNDTALGAALLSLRAAASTMERQSVEDEYSALFFGMGQGGEVLPYASYYLTGNLHDRPLADLRGDMSELGIAHAKLNNEPEDHIGYLFEIMHGLITGTLGGEVLDSGPADLTTQMVFFDAHIKPWAEDFFADLEAAQSAAFYVAVSAVAKALLVIEREAFQMAA